MKKRCLAVIALLLVVFCLVGCQQTNLGTQGGKNTASPMTDLEGNEIVLPEKTEKIISLSAANTEILLALGLADKLIAVDNYSIALDGVNKDLMQFDLMKPDTERIIAQEADIIFVTSMSNAGGDDVYKPVRDAGICVVAVPSADSIDDIKKDIRFIGEVTGKAEEAQDVVKQMEAEIDQVKQKTASAAEKKRVYFEIGAEPKLYTFGTETFLNEMLTIIGAENIFADQAGWITVSEENVIAANPDVILTNVGYVDDPVGAVYARDGWDSIQAVKNKQVFYIDKNASSLASQNIVIALKQMAQAIYPELYQN